MSSDISSLDIESDTDLLQIGADCLSLQERHQKLLGNFVEVHPANTSNVDEVVKRKMVRCMVEDKCHGFESDDGRNELLLDCFW